MVQLIPCPSAMEDELRAKFDKNPIQHFVLWDTTYGINEEGSCKVVDFRQFQNLRRSDGYDPDRYKAVASIGEPGL
jgi:hypothetical protein